MASDRNSSQFRAGINERLAEARDNALLEGEEVIAEEAGDQGQAIVLTGSRVIVLKVGLAATGAVNGHRVTAFGRDHITAVRLRKGPMGAVIQICADRSADAASEIHPSDNVVVFSDPGKDKKCEAMAARIASALEVPIERVQPDAADSAALQTEMPKPTRRVEPDAQVSEPPAAAHPRPSSTRREPVSLADEIYAEIAGPREPDLPPAREPVLAAAPSSTAAEQRVTTDEHADFGPNPHLPKPTRLKRTNSLQALLLVAVLAGLVIVGMAVTGPRPLPATPPQVVLDSSDLTLNPDALRSRLRDVDDYRNAVTALIQSCDPDVEAFKAALTSGNREALSAVKPGKADEAWRTLTALEPPAGLVGARSKLTSGMFALKATIAETLSREQTGGTFDSRQVAQRVTEAEKTIGDGFAEIDRMRAQLESRLAEAAKKSRGD